MQQLEEDPDRDQWIAVLAGRRLEVSGDDFARRLDDLAWKHYGVAWEDLGTEAYIEVLGEARGDVAYWLKRALPRGEVALGNTVARTAPRPEPAARHESPEEDLSRLPIAARLPHAGPRLATATGGGHSS